MGPDIIKISTTQYRIKLVLGKWFLSSIITKSYNVKRYVAYPEGMKLEYYPDTYRLMVRFNIPRLLYGDNMIPAMCFDINKLTTTLNDVLQNYVEFYDITDDENRFRIHPRYHDWTCNEIEYNVDIPVPENLISPYISVIKKIQLSRKEKDTYEDETTSVYHQSSNDHRKSGIRNIVYNKLEERKRQLPEDKLLDAVSQTTLQPGESLLRFEVRYKRRAISYRSGSTRTTVNHGEVVDISSKRDLQFDRFIEAIRYERQILVMKRVLSDYHLNLPIKTKRDLFKAVKETTRSAKYKDGVLKTIEFLNGTRKRQPFNPDTTTRHRKFITSLGIHYIYSDIELPPLTLDYALTRLTMLEQEQIRQYKILEAATGYSSSQAQNSSLSLI